MYSLIVKLMIMAALIQLGISLDKFISCSSRECSSRIEKASRDVLKIDWMTCPHDLVHLYRSFFR